MTNTAAVPFPENKIQQFVVQFAHKVPVKKQLTPGEKRALEGVLRELDPNSEFFQIFEDSTVQNAGCLFQALCQHPVDAAQITMPSFVLAPDSFTFIHPIRVLMKGIGSHQSLDTFDLNAKVRTWSSKLQDAVNHLRCQRTGKVYQLVLGQFAPNEKKEIFNLFSDKMNFDEAGEANLTFTYYRDIQGATFNINTIIGYVQNKLDNGFLINVKVDINNRQLKQSMEPSEIEKVWNTADSLIGEHLANTLNVR